MVKYSRAALDATFGALADPTRRAILARLARGESSVTALAAQFDISLPGVVKHLRVLEAARLLRSTKQGRVRRCRFSPQPLRDAAAWIAFYQQFWEEQFEALEDFIEEMKKEDRSWQPPQQARKPASSSGAPSPRRGRKSSTRGSTPS